MATQIDQPAAVSEPSQGSVCGGPVADDRFRLIYTNRGGLRTAFVTDHARRRFVERFRRILKHRGNDGGVFAQKNASLIDNGGVDQVIGWLFERSRKIERAAYSKILKKRNRRHGNGVRFRARPFEFVIEDGHVITIEICENSLRNLN